MIPDLGMPTEFPSQVTAWLMAMMVIITRQQDVRVLPEYSQTTKPGPRLGEEATPPFSALNE